MESWKLQNRRIEDSNKVCEYVHKGRREHRRLSMTCKPVEEASANERSSKTQLRIACYI